MPYSTDASGGGGRDGHLEEADVEHEHDAPNSNV
jgi:hypothetical protein